MQPPGKGPIFVIVALKPVSMLSVRIPPQVVSEEFAVTFRLPSLALYVAAVITTESKCGGGGVTDTAVVAVEIRPKLLVTVSWKVSDTGIAPACSVGAVNVMVGKELGDVKLGNTGNPGSAGPAVWDH